MEVQFRISVDRRADPAGVPAGINHGFSTVASGLSWSWASQTGNAAPSGGGHDNVAASPKILRR